MDTDSCIIRGGTVVCADRVLPDCDVVVIDGRIAAIEPVGASDFDEQPRSEERRVGKECSSECRSRWSPYH